MTAGQKLAIMNQYAPTTLKLDLSRLTQPSAGELRAQAEGAPGRTIGALGAIPFYVSDYAVQTFQNAVWSGGGNYAAHKRIGSTTLVEATGSDADTFTFDMLLSADLGVNPWDAISELLAAERQQAFLLLTIGDHAYGRYRWLIADHKINLNKFDRNGSLYEAVVSVKLIEYLRE
jgi:hypothetical protein